MAVAGCGSSSGTGGSGGRGGNVGGGGGGGSGGAVSVAGNSGADAAAGRGGSGGGAGADAGGGDHVTGGADGGGTDSVSAGDGGGPCGGATCAANQICVFPQCLNCTLSLPPFCADVPASCPPAPTCACLPFLICAHNGMSGGACLTIDLMGVRCG